ncbi:MAG: hypothetical protein MJ245_01405, partial [Clostridia bacterium]|nr:hypothetical protein [Clostridia bacterium]
DLKRREMVLNKIFESFGEDLDYDNLELKYELGAEGAKEVFKTRCVYVDRCDNVLNLIESVSQSEIKLSKLMLYLMKEDRRQDVYYISADIDPFYPMLSNRIVRDDASKTAILHDKYDTKELLEKFQPQQTNENNN